MSDPDQASSCDAPTSCMRASIYAHTPKSSVRHAAQQQNDDELNDYLIDHCYRLMKSAVTEDARRYWGERLAYYTRRRFSEVETKKALGVVA